MGKNLFEQVTEMTGLPIEPVRRDLKKHLDLHKIDIDDLTIEDLRRIMIQYLLETVDETLDPH